MKTSCVQMVQLAPYISLKVLVLVLANCLQAEACRNLAVRCLLPWKFTLGQELITVCCRTHAIKSTMTDLRCMFLLPVRLPLRLRKKVVRHKMETLTAIKDWICSHVPSRYCRRGCKCKGDTYIIFHENNRIEVAYFSGRFSYVANSANNAGDN